MKYNGLRYLTKQIKGEPLTSETSVNKLHRASLEIEMDDFAIELSGQASLQLRGGEEAVDGGTWSKGALNWPTWSSVAALQTFSATLSRNASWASRKTEVTRCRHPI